MAQTIEGFVGTSLDDARMSPIHWRVFALISAGYFFDVCDYVILGALIPDMVRSGFATPAQIATVASATLFGLFVGTLAQGEFTDRFGRKTVYQFNLLLYGLATIAAAFSPNYIWLAVLRFIAGYRSWRRAAAVLRLRRRICAEEHSWPVHRRRADDRRRLVMAAFHPVRARVSRHARLARHLDRHRRVRADRVPVPLLAAGIATLAGDARPGRSRARAARGAWASPARARR